MELSPCPRTHVIILVWGQLSDDQVSCFGKEYHAWVTSESWTLFNKNIQLPSSPEFIPRGLSGAGGWGTVFIRNGFYVTEARKGIFNLSWPNNGTWDGWSSRMNWVALLCHGACVDELKASDCTWRVRHIKHCYVHGWECVINVRLPAIQLYKTTFSFVGSLLCPNKHSYLKGCVWIIKQHFLSTCVKYNKHHHYGHASSLFGCRCHRWLRASHLPWLLYPDSLCIDL